MTESPPGRLLRNGASPPGHDGYARDSVLQQPPSVVHVVWGAGFGGIERFVADLARAQATDSRSRPARQADVGVMVCGAATGDESLASYGAPGVTVTGGGLRSGFDVRPSRLRVIARELAAYDVVHLHGFTPGTAPAIMAAKRPLVFTEHGLLGLDQRWPSQGAVKQSAKGLFLRQKATAVACVSDWVAREAQRKYRLNDGKVFVVPDGADFSRIFATRSRVDVLSSEGIDPAAWVMVVTARLVRFKRIDRLLQAAARLDGGGREWALLVAGSGPLEATLKEMCAELGIAERVRFLGYRRDTWDLVSAADLAPVPSDFEAFGLVVIEAMALDRPVVAFADSGGPAEIIGKVGGGRIVQTVEECATVLEQSRGGAPIAQSRPLNRDLLQKTYSIQAAVAAYARLYEAARVSAGRSRQAERE
jgi:glycosyltransferase involved in cell wall biosynthesis